MFLSAKALPSLSLKTWQFGSGITLAQLMCAASLDFAILLNWVAARMACLHSMSPILWTSLSSKRLLKATLMHASIARKPLNYYGTYWTIWTTRRRSSTELRASVRFWETTKTCAYYTLSPTYSRYLCSSPTTYNLACATISATVQPWPLSFWWVDVCQTTFFFTHFGCL